MHIALAQLDQVVGDLAGNARRILDAAGAARRGGASLVVTPELSLCGYPPEDLLLRPAFLDACESELAALTSGEGDAIPPPGAGIASAGASEREAGSVPA